MQNSRTAFRRRASAGLLAISAALPALPALTTAASAFTSRDRWAVIRFNQASSPQRWEIVRGMGATGVRMLSGTPLGRYVVTFDRDVRECGYIASLGQPDVTLPSQAQIAVAPYSDREILVVVTESDGTPGTAPFHLFVSCGT